ncbi:hypothetical protein ACR1PO_15845 [Chryseobacterium sp. RRHN12]|uniref:hypothetical protein n=1 Tax=Chryseobacterium sp. RRHN12 TaxID=3437884 RepID=UPI003D9B6450
MKLIPLSDFVLEQDKITSKRPLRGIYTYKAIRSYDKIVGYANFLKQSVHEGMFIPIDEQGNIISRPNLEGGYTSFGYSSEAFEVITKYKKAEKKVFFKGICKTGMFDKPISEMIVEDLVKFEFELTPSALEAIGIKE